MFLREQVIKRGGKKYIYHQIVKVYWDKVRKKVRHKIIMSLGRLTEEEKIIVKNLLSLKEKKDVFVTSWDDIKIKKSLEYLAPVILHKIFKFFSFCDFIDKNVRKKADVKVSNIFEILTIFRCIKPSSYLKVSSFCKKTILPYLLGISPSKINPTRIYRTLDEIIKIEDKLQKHIYNKIKELELDNFNLVYYDITSTYFEGRGDCSLVLYGLSRDKRPDKRQILLALAVTKKGYPFYWEVLKGNVVDKTTVKNILNNLKEKFGIRNCCIVLDRGMVTDDNLDKIDKNSFSFIVTLTKDEIKKLEWIPWEFLKTIREDNVDDKKKRFKYYNERAYFEELKEQGGKRYILCFNPEKFLQERKDRADKIKDIEEYLRKKNAELLSAKKMLDKSKIEKWIYYYLKKRGAMKYFKDIEIEERIKEVSKKYKGGYKKREVKVYFIKYRIDNEKIEEEELLDGVYVICSNLYKDSDGREVSCEELISSYRERIKIERAFLDMKQFLELRPIYHRKEFRIKAHILICCITYLINVVLQNKLRDRGMSGLTSRMVLEILEGFRANEVEIGNIKEKKIKLQEADEQQKEIIKVLGYEDVLCGDKILKESKDRI
jgi:transposase